MITIFETGLIDYSDLDLVKPVKVTEDDLRMIASNTMSVDLTDEHSSNVLSSLSNFIVKNNRLMTNEPKDVDFKGKGFSPVINCDELIDEGDFYRMNGIHMSSIGLTTSPRNKILYNSIGESMSNNNDDDFRKLVADNRSLTEEVGSLKNQLTSMTKKYDDANKELQNLKKSIKDNNDKLGDLEQLKEKAKLYDDFVESERQDLIKELVGDDESKAERYASFTNEQLKISLEDRKNSRKKRGVTNPQTTIQDGYTPSPEDPDDDYYDWDTFESDCEILGV